MAMQTVGSSLYSMHRDLNTVDGEYTVELFPMSEPTEIRWETELIEFEATGLAHNFRWEYFAVEKPGYGGLIGGGVQNVTHLFDDDAYGLPGVYGTTEPGLGLYLTTQFQLGHGRVPGGVATGGGGQSLVDNIQDWTPGSLIGKSIWIRNDQARRTITSNTRTVISWVGALSGGEGGNVIAGDEYTLGSGYATGGSTTTLDDSTRNWTPGGLVGRPVAVRISEYGVVASTEEYRWITANTATQISWATPLTNGAVVAGVEYTLDRTADFHLDGHKLIVDPTVYPFWGRSFEDVDFLGGIAEQAYTRGAIAGETFSPITLNWHIRKVGVEVSPRGNLNRALDGAWRPLTRDGYPHDYSLWDCFVSINGVQQHVGRRFLSNTYVPYISYAEVPGGPLVLNQEHFQDVVAAPITNLKTLVRHRNLEFFTGKYWVPLDRWRIHGRHVTSPAETRYGYSVDPATRDLVSQSGHAGDTAGAQREPGTNFWIGHTCRADGPDAVMTHQGIVEVTFGGFAAPPAWTPSTLYYRGSYVVEAGNTYYCVMNHVSDLVFNGTGETNGPWVQVTSINHYKGTQWTQSASCYVLEDQVRGYLIIKPSAARAAKVRYTAKKSSKHRFVADIAPVSDAFIGNVNGIEIAVLKNNSVIHRGVIAGLTHTVPNNVNPFAGTGNMRFDFEIELALNDTIDFRAAGVGGSVNFGEMAFRCVRGWV